MADFISSLNFSKLISHVFPGFLFIFSIFMIMDSFCASPGTYTYKIFQDKNLEMFIAIVGIFLIIGTMIGIIIDGIQHITITKYFEKFYNNYEERKNINKLYAIIDSILLEKFIEIYKIDTNIDKNKYITELDGNKLLDLYFYNSLINSEKFSYIEDNFYYYYEFFANTFLVLLVSTPSVFFYTHEALKLSFVHSFYISSVIFITLVVCLYRAWCTYKDCKLVNVNFILGTLVEKAINKNS